MSSKNVTFRMDEELKQRADALFEEMGISMTTALNAFVRQTVREGKIPFEFKGDERAFWDSVDERLREGLQYAQGEGAVWHEKDESFAKADALLAELRKGGGRDGAV